MEPLNTDEPIAPGSRKLPKDMDAAMLAGCSAFLIVSFSTYLLALWPFLVFQQSELSAVLVKAAGFAFPPALIVGIAGIRRAGLAGACGFVAGAMTTAVFLFLRLQQVFVAAAAGQGAKPDYPEVLRILIPIGWFIFVLAVSILLVPKREITEDEDGPTN